MNIPVQLFIYLIIVLTYYFYKKKKGATSRFILNQLGLSLCSSRYYKLSILFAILSLLIAVSIIYFLSFDKSLLIKTSYKNYDIPIFSFSTILLILLKELVFTVIGEEVIFRGLIGGYLFRRFSFIKANSIQTAIFLLPHMLLLFVSVKLLPLLFFIAFSGWLLGWLRYISGSILPAIIMHALVNAGSIVAFHYIYQ